MKKLLSIKYWIFDLDNTLYSGKTKVFEQVDKKMSKYISNKLNVNIDEAKKIQKNYFYKYNTTLNGIIKNHKIDANDFLDFVHDINIDFLKKDLKLNKELEKLDGKKIIFTNGSKKHALNITQKIGIDHHFDDFFDIIDAINNGVRAVAILDGRKPHSILFELFSDKGSGTLIRK